MKDREETRMKKPVLTISLLASNRPDTIRKCLDSLVSIREAVPSELIIVDTSNSEDIHNILLEYTEQVHKFEWCNDFSKARNVGLKNANGEWFLYLDDDEWFVETEDLIRFFQSGEYKEYGSACYQVRSFYDVEQTCYEDIWVSRMIRVDGDTEFRSKIHEYMYPVRGKGKHISALAYHSGYIYVTEEQKKAHFERNTKLLKEMIQEEPENLRWPMQLIQEYRSMRKWENVCSYCQNGLKETMRINDKYNNIYLGTFYAGYIEALMMQNQHKQALDLCAKALQDERNTDLCRLYVCMKLAEIYFVMQKYKEANEYANTYLKVVKEYKQNAEVFAAQEMALLVNDASTEQTILYMHQLMEQSYIPSFGLGRWMEYVDAREKDGIIELEGLRTYVNEVFSSNDLRYLYFMKCYGNQLIRLESTTESFEQLYKRFFDFMEYTLGYYLCIFKDVAFQGEMEMLPVDAKAAIVLHRMFSREENDWINKVRDLRECVTVYPVLGNNIKRLVGMIAELDSLKRKE